MSRILLLILLLALCVFTGRVRAQDTLRGRVVDASSREGVPFATVKVSGSLEGSPVIGTVADLDGFFLLGIKVGDSVQSLEVSQYGYQPARKPASVTDPRPLTISLSRKDGVIEEVIVRPRYDKIRRIINRASRARASHNPDRYTYYRCNIYYKMTADADFAASATDSAEAREARAFQAGQHLFVSESYYRRTGRAPGQVQEDVLATRFSGLPNTALAPLVTGVLPFHAAQDFLTLNGKEYPSPLAPGWEGRYVVNLSEELQDGADTLWVFSFSPRRDPTGIRGRLTIHSNGYAVSRLLAETRDTALGRTLRIEQQYERADGRWFPRALNYVLDWNQKSGSSSTPILMRGTSRVDSVSFSEEGAARMDKAHSVRIIPGAERTADTAWARYRLEELGAREARAYEFDDSVMKATGFARIIPYLDNLVQGRVPLGPFDVELKRLYAFNPYEKNRFGLGWRTNEKVSDRFSIGAWAGYGTADKTWKYGAFAEAYVGRYRETTIGLSYDNDLRDPGRVTIHREVDRAYLRQYLLQRVDRVEFAQAYARWKTGYLQAEIAARMEDIAPQYAYSFLSERGPANTFQAREGIVSLRYAFAERSAPVFGKYSSAGTRYPVLYAKLTGGLLSMNNLVEEVKYVQAVAAISWQGSVNQLGTERVLITAGQSWSDAPLPISKLFAGRGFRSNNHFYVFGGLLTMRPYEYYADRFATLHLRHDFLWKFFRRPRSAPYLSLAYNGMIGMMNDRVRHTGVDFSVPDNAYHEAGVLVNDLLRIKYLNVAWLSVNAGYFYHIVPGSVDQQRNGVAVIGLGFSI